MVPPEIGRGGGGKKNLFQSFRLFSNRKHGGGGGRMGGGKKANPSARGVNRDKRRIVLRIQSVTIQAAYGEGEGMT